MPIRDGPWCRTASNPIAPLKSTLEKFVRSTPAALKSAPLRSAESRFATVRDASQRLAPLRFALLRSVASRDAPWRSASARCALERSAYSRSAYLRSAPPRSAPWRSSRTVGVLKRHRFHALTPCFRMARCSGLAMAHYASGSRSEAGIARTQSDAPLRESDLRASSRAEKSRRIPETRKIRVKCARAIQSACQFAPVNPWK